MSTIRINPSCERNPQEVQRPLLGPIQKLRLIMLQTLTLKFVVAATALSGILAQDYDLVDSQVSRVPATVEAEYSCMFINSWSGSRHPIDYPTTSARWSPPIVFAHDSTYHVWQGGVLALGGVQGLAEGRYGLISAILLRACRICHLESNIIHFLLARSDRWCSVESQTERSRQLCGRQIAVQQKYTEPDTSHIESRTRFPVPFGYVYDCSKSRLVHWNGQFRSAQWGVLVLVVHNRHVPLGLGNR